MLSFLSRCPLFVQDGSQHNILDVIDFAIKSIGLELLWTPDKIDNLYLDDLDHFGLFFWYQAIEKKAKDIKESSKGKK